MELFTLSQKLRSRLTQPLPGIDFQRRMMAQAKIPIKWPKRDTFMPAAVLILLFPSGNDIYFYLTKRTERVQHHKGQVSLPGGAQEPDESLGNTALRETREEIGIPEEAVTLLGPLSPLPVPVTGFMVLPFIGTAEQEMETNHAEEEVAKVFKVPLLDLLDDSRLETEARIIQDTPYQIPFFHFDQVKVWGATSMILGELKQVLKECL